SSARCCAAWPWCAWTSSRRSSQHPPPLAPSPLRLLSRLRPPERPRRHPPAAMQLRLDQLGPHLQKAGAALKPIYTLHGDEALLAQEALDAIRAAARAQGYTERQVHTVAGQHFSWSSLLGAGSAMSLFGDRQFIEIRIP